MRTLRTRLGAAALGVAVFLAVTIVGWGGAWLYLGPFPTDEKLDGGLCTVLFLGSPIAGFLLGLLGAWLVIRTRR